MGPILVTGVSGFVGSRVVEALLAAGHSVRGTVRSLAKAPKLDGVPGSDRLELVEADLLSPGSFDAAAKDAVGVIHTASPYQIDAKDPQKELVDPALEGTMEVLGAALRSSSVRRVVFTSSMVAVTDSPEPRVMNEDDWNTQSSLERNPYYYSKAVAERAAWRFMEERKPSWDLVVVNPSVVIGPSLVPSVNTSTKIFADLLNGAYPAILDLAWSFVDVRDVAHAHLRALEVPTAKGRHVCVAETVTMRRVVADPRGCRRRDEAQAAEARPRQRGRPVPGEARFVRTVAGRRRVPAHEPRASGAVRQHEDPGRARRDLPTDRAVDRRDGRGSAEVGPRPMNALRHGASRDERSRPSRRLKVRPLRGDNRETPWQFAHDPSIHPPPRRCLFPCSGSSASAPSCSSRS